MTAHCASMQEVSITLRPLPSSHWIAQDFGTRTSVVSLDDCIDGLPVTALALVGARLDGLPLRFRRFDASTVFIEPMVPLQGGRVELRFVSTRVAPAEPREAIQSHRANLPLPSTTWGLQAPSGRLQRQAQ